MSKKLTYKYVNQYFKKKGCYLLEKEYANNRTKMKYICNCGNVSEISFGSFQCGRRCIKCGSCEKGRRCKDCAGLKKHTFEYVKKYFSNNNCKLLETNYQNIDAPMKYECECGEISKITFYHFKNGQRCKKCSIIKRSGEKHFNYNPNLTDEEREFNKNRTTSFLYKRWRKKVFKRDKYICQKCLQKAVQLNAHHIESWASNKKLRLAESNGITFCEKCHKQFHKKYRKIDNNRKQLDEYLNAK